MIKDNNITHTASAPSNLDTATTTRFAQTELQSTKELRATASEIAAPKPDLDAKAKEETIWSTIFKGILKGKSPAPKLKLDDGWPESVEEQGLLLLVLRHYITRQYIKNVL